MKKVHLFGQELSKIAFGGVIVSGEKQEDADRFVDEALAMGVNYFDVAPTYGDAEVKLGNAFKGRREDVFLACKTEDRTKAGAQKLLDASLKNLKTDYFDLYQLHAVYNLEDVEQIFGPDGAFETFKKAKEDGVIKRIGFSAHSTEAALALMSYYDFDSILFPFNFVSMLKNGYGMHVLKEAKKRNMAILGIKSMALTEHLATDDVDHPKAWYHPIEDFELASSAVRYAVNQGVDVIIPPGDFASFKWAVEIAEGSLDLTEADMTALNDAAKMTVPLFPLKQR